MGYEYRLNRPVTLLECSETWHPYGVHSSLVVGERGNYWRFSLRGDVQLVGIDEEESSSRFINRGRFAPDLMAILCWYRDLVAEGDAGELLPHPGPSILDPGLFLKRSLDEALWIQGHCEKMRPRVGDLVVDVFSGVKGVYVGLVTSLSLVESSGLPPRIRKRRVACVVPREPGDALIFQSGGPSSSPGAQGQFRSLRWNENVDGIINDSVQLHSCEYGDLRVL